MIMIYLQGRRLKNVEKYVVNEAMKIYREHKLRPEPEFKEAVSKVQRQHQKLKKIYEEGYITEDTYKKTAKKLKDIIKRIEKR